MFDGSMDSNHRDGFLNKSFNNTIYLFISFYLDYDLLLLLLLLGFSICLARANDFRIDIWYTNIGGALCSILNMLLWYIIVWEEEFVPLISFSLSNRSL